jgi:hypothetical protein
MVSVHAVCRENVERNSPFPFSWASLLSDVLMMPPNLP